MYGENVPSSIAKQHVDKLMKKFDRDNNGLLSEKEFVDGKLTYKEELHFGNLRKIGIRLQNNTYKHVKNCLK